MADLDEIVVIDIASAAIKQRIPVTGAKFLNDVTIDKSGAVYVSDSETGKVHLLKGGKVSDYLGNYWNMGPTRNQPPWPAA